MKSASRWESAVEELFPRALRDRLVQLRRALHAEPELAFQEYRTAERLHEALSSLGGRDIERVTETGIVLRIPGRDRSAPTVAIRGDIDALPIQEETGLPYASLVPGVMHACGHDVHATWATGAAALLLAEPAHGDVVVLLQPAEESGGGAARMIEAGALDTVAMIFGGHVDRRFLVGQIVADSGPLAASADAFEIVLNGRGAHAARPHESADPVVAAAALITTVQQIVSRRLNPADAGVLTVATIHAGLASNVIPESARITGTIRAVRPETRALLKRELERITAGIALAHDLAATVEFSDGTPPLVNTDDATGFAREAVTALLGADALAPLGMLNLAGEDFAHYLEHVPGCFLRIGAREDGGEATPAHNPRFAAAEDSIFVGAAVLAATARVASAALGGLSATSGAGKSRSSLRLEGPAVSSTLSSTLSSETALPADNQMSFELQPNLSGALVHLRPLTEGDFDALFAVAADPAIWEQHPASDRYLVDVFRAFFADAMASRGALLALDAITGEVMGSSRYNAYDEELREIEIGWTFLAVKYWGGAYNGEMKHLMLRHAFRFVDRVLFLVGPSNIRSQRAVEKIGGVRRGERTDATGRTSLVFALASDAFKTGASEPR